MPNSYTTSPIREVHLPGGTRTIKFSEIPRLIADSLHPSGSDESAPNYSAWITCVRWTTLNSLPLAVQKGLLPVRNPLVEDVWEITADGKGLELLSVSVVHVKDLEKYLAGSHEITLFVEGGETVDLSNRQNEQNSALPAPANTVTRPASDAHKQGSATPQPQAAPEKTPLLATPKWQEMAVERAIAIIERDGKKQLYPSQINIADEVSKAFRAAGVVGAGGKPLTGAYIKRHALRGISSEKTKQLSTATRWGK